MKPHWPTVPLGEVLTPVSRSEKLDPMKEYRLLGVRLDGAGPFLRETKLGSQTSAGTLSRVEAGDFIYSRLFAWRGAFGIISEDLDGCYVSGEFPTFAAVPGKVDLKFLNYWFRLPATLETVEADCTGSTPLTRNRFKEEFFLALEIPLPAVTEQRRIVARIEQLAAQIEQARRLRHQASEATEALIAGKISSLFSDGASDGWQKGVLGDCLVDDCYGTSVKTTDDSTGTPVLRMGNIQGGKLDVRDLKYFHFTQLELSKLLLRQGDIIVNRTNSAELAQLSVLRR